MKLISWIAAIVLLLSGAAGAQTSSYRPTWSA